MVTTFVFISFENLIPKKNHIYYYLKNITIKAYLIRYSIPLKLLKFSEKQLINNGCKNLAVSIYLRKFINQN